MKELVLPLSLGQKYIAPTKVSMPDYASDNGRLTYLVFLAEFKAENAEVISSRKYPIPSPTIMFIKSGHLTSIVSSILSEAKKSWFLQPFAWRHKLAGVADGFITNQSLWDRLVFDGARARVIGDSAATLRAVVISGGMTTFLSFAVS
jgi:hypothetical protein